MAEESSSSESESSEFNTDPQDRQTYFYHGLENIYYANGCPTANPEPEDRVLVD